MGSAVSHPRPVPVRPSRGGERVSGCREPMRRCVQHHPEHDRSGAPGWGRTIATRLRKRAAGVAGRVEPDATVLHGRACHAGTMVSGAPRL